MLVNVTEHLISWSNGNASGDAGEYVYDLDHGQLWRLGSEEGYSVIYGKRRFCGVVQLEKTQQVKLAFFRVAEWK